jgi:ParB/RepB/Spo0J family partition protein
VSWHDRLRRHVYWTCAIAEAGDLDRTGALALVWDELLSLGPYEHAPRKAWLGLVRQYDQHRQQWSQWPPAGLARQYGAEPDGLRSLITEDRVATRKKTFEEQVQADIDAAHAQLEDRGESVGGVLDDSPRNPGETPPTPAGSPPTAPLGGRFELAPIGRLHANQNNPRADAGALEDLAASIAEVGVLQPLVVRPIEGLDGYEVVAGHRRLEAARLVGLDVLPVMVRQLDPVEALELAVTENSARLDVSPVDDAHAVYQLARRGRSVAQIARVVGRGPAWVRTRLAIARAEPEVQGLLREGKSGVREAATAAAMDPDEQREWVQRILEGRSYTPAGLSGEQRRLRNAPWALDSERHEAGIVWAQLDGVVAPSCAACDRRTDAQRPLFGDVADDQALYDAACLGGRCWRSKVDAIAERAAQRVVPIGQLYGPARRFADEQGVPRVVAADGTIGYQADRLVEAAATARAAGAAGAPMEYQVTEWSNAAKTKEERESEREAERERRRLEQVRRDEQLAARRAAEDAAAEQLSAELRERLGSDSLWIMAVANLIGTSRQIEPTSDAIANYVVDGLAHSESAPAAILGEEPSDHATSYAKERYAWLRAVYLQTPAGRREAARAEQGPRECVTCGYAPCACDRQ